MGEKIAIYDVRGIQNYIFRTNSVKEIIGGSKIVSNLIIHEFENAVNILVADNKFELEREEVILDWESQESFNFENNEKIKIEVLYYGGGNLVVLFRNEELCKEVSILMAKNIMENAYGLSLVYAYVDKTTNYNEDWTNLKIKLSEIKAVTPLNKPTGILPVVQYDALTGMPLSKTYNNKKVTLEAYQKLKKYEEVQKEENNYIKEFDKMRTSKEEGLIAIVHIDGNSMGENIRKIMQGTGTDTCTYATAVKKMRKISNDIHNVFEVKAIENVQKEIINICQKHDIKVTEDGIPFRPLIQAGDDITFVCNERIALDITQEYIKSIKTGYMYNGDFKFSACGGIAIIHSHFPFYKGYIVAEQCCKSAKERAKNEGKIENKIGNKVEDKIGNFVDFEYCYSGINLNLEEERKSNYKNIDGIELLRRPYGIYDENDSLTEDQKNVDIEEFKKDLKKLKNISRNTVKTFRDNYYENESVIETSILRYEVKNDTKLGEPFIDLFGKKCARFFDATEIIDIWGTKEDNNE